VKNANRHAAVNLEVTGGVAHIAVAATSNMPALTVTLSGAAGQFCEKKGSASPGKPFRTECAAPPNAGRLTVRASSGAKEVISYTVVDGAAGSAPDVVHPPARPESIPNNEGLFYAGLRLEQLHSAALDPEDYYREILRRDPGDPKANVALGVRALRRADYAGAETMLTKALARTTGSYLRPKDGEPHYFLGLAQRALGKESAARDSFARAAWVAGWESPAGYQLAEMSSVRGDWSAAIAHLDRALAANGSNVKALTLKAALLRKSKRPPSA
jgi:tetratricopeptide (TPR) repeat protein